MHSNIYNKVLTDDSSDPTNGSFPVPATELNGSESSRSSSLEVNGVLPLLELKGSAATTFSLENGSDAAVLLSWEENRSGSAEPVFELKGSEEANGSSEENLAEEDCLKKASVANGSVPLKGSLAKGSGQKNKYFTVV